MTKQIHVAVGVIFDCPKGSIHKTEPSILIAKRADHQHQGGLWEFPGGKVEAGETVQYALQRELEEELGFPADIEQMWPLIRIPFHYPDKSVLLDVWAVYGAGDFKNQMGNDVEAVGKEGQPLVWVKQSELSKYQFPAANKAILDALSLPTKIAITLDNADPKGILKQVANTLQHHQPIWIQLRAPSLDQQQYTQLAMQLYGLCHEAGSKLIWNCSLDWYQIAFADGLHLSAERGKILANNKLTSAERPIPNNQWLSTSCHNADELKDAQKWADYALISAVNKTQTHPNAEPLTWDGFETLTAESQIPCYALGGMSVSDLTVSDLTTAQMKGGQGIAGIRCFSG